MRTAGISELVKPPAERHHLLPFRWQDPLDLLEVVDIVPRSHADYKLNRFLSALGMHPVVFPLLGCQRLKQGKIGFAEHAKLLD
jgi:hypothetical protein